MFRSSGFFFAMSIVLLCLLYFNTLRWLLDSWIHDPYYSHGSLVAAISLYFALKRRNEIKGDVEVKGIYILCFSLLLHVFATFFDVRYLSAVSLLLSLFSVILTFYGIDSAKKFSFPIFFMIFAIPFPIYGITNVLEVLSASSSVSFVRLLGIEASNVGAEIHLETASFIVGAPCSGIRSIISLLTVATLYSYLIRDSLKVKAALIALSVPIAFFANVFRISSILIVADLFGRDAALGFFHYASDLVLFTVAVLILVFARRCLKWLT